MRQALIVRRRDGYMLDDEIQKARERLNESIITGKDYKEIYQLSVELDELIAKYYLDTEDSGNTEKK